MRGAQQSELEKHIMAVLVGCTQVRTAGEFTQLIEGPCRAVLPHEAMLCGIGGVSGQGSHLRKVLQVNYPMAYFEPLRDADGRLDSPLMRRWRASGEPQWFQSGRDDHQVPAEWLRLFNRYALRNTLAHGVPDLGGAYASFFIFSRMPGEVGQEQAFLMQLLTPHLHFALMRVLATVDDYPAPPSGKRKALSDRQREILHWLQQGKTNWEIARILGLSELNVKYHIDQIFLKLEVRSRAQAVARARDLAGCV